MNNQVMKVQESYLLYLVFTDEILIIGSENKVGKANNTSGLKSLNQWSFQIQNHSSTPTLLVSKNSRLSG